MRFTIAVDGPAAAGKGTLCAALVREFGFAYIDTGLLYRATGRRALDGEDPVAAARDLSPGALRQAGLRSAEVGQAASRVSAIPGVRAALLDFQRNIALRDGGVVLDGRDIGTVVCPGADLKFHVVADEEVRARRRHGELVVDDPGLHFETVLADLRARDARDRARAAAPLKPAADAIRLDTSQMPIDDAAAAAIVVVRARLNSVGAPADPDPDGAGRGTADGPVRRPAGAIRDARAPAARFEEGTAK